MKTKHVILREISAPAYDGGLLGAGPAGLPAAAGAKQLTVDVDELDDGRAPDLMREKGVLGVAPVMLMKLIEPAAGPPVEPSADAVEWGVRAVGADTSPFSGAGSVVAVLDTGIDDTHPAFAGVTLVQEDFTGEGNGDWRGHGTHCAGTIFGRAVDGKRIGVATGVTTALIGKVIGSKGAASDTLVAAIQWAASKGAQIISMSLGMDFPGYQLALQRDFPPEIATSRALEGYRANVLLFERLAGAIRAMGSLGRPTIIVAAAGNESQRDVNPEYKVAVAPPAVSDGIISVAAVGRAAGGLVVAPFSNAGAMIAGPGVGIVSAKAGGGLKPDNGTSMATPHVAGVAALWVEKLRTAGPLNPTLLANRIVGSAVMEQGLDQADVGNGLVRAPQN